jgi:predicted nucleic acid-binding protein
MRPSTSSRGHLAERRHQRDLVDTSVVIDLGRVDPADLPTEIAVSAVTLAELPLYTRNPDDFQELHVLLEVVPVQCPSRRS